jgi:membrane associated rhomboid family serine protease
MLPLKDDIPTRTVPFVTVGLIAANILAFFYQMSLGLTDDPAALRAAQQFVFEFGLIPCRMGEVCPSRLATALAGAPHPWLTVFTSMFVHGGLFHVGGNMLYLWVFGDNVEDAMGHLRFLVFYLVTGVLAALAHVATQPASPVPLIGASGAIAGVLGAYLILYPRARVLSLVVLGIFIRLVELPALLVLALWFLLQLVEGFGTLRAPDVTTVAWWAHIGGFVAGAVLVFAFARRGRGRGSVSLSI